MARTVQGKTYKWQLSDAPIGSGDAGEVFTVACVDQPELTGVMKKPARIATGGTLQRQAGQIAQEGLALARLDGLPKGKAHPPRLLDQAPDFTAGTANYFIVSETAPGLDLAAMLNQTRLDGKPFPRRVIITVLDALFDLFARAHRVGVLWNDVKLDHIYWHNLTGGVAVIDWGNALFLDEAPTNGQRVLPRWEDYRQMVDTLGGFLQQNAPELYTDLGWDEFQGQELNLSTVSVLARRIAYQQQVVALRVMEYQALIRVILRGDPALEGLQKIQTYQKLLEQIGAPWDAVNVLAYAQTLVEHQLAEGDRTSAVRSTTIVWDLFGDSLGLSWHLLKEYFQYPGLLSHGDLPDLVKFTLAEQWSEALWTLTHIARDLDAIPWWNRLIPVLRQKALGVISPAPYQIGESVLAWAVTEGDETLVNTVTAILQNWRLKGEDLAESPFEYALLDLIRNGAGLPRRLQSELKQTFAAGEEAIRELFQVWVNMHWDAFPKAFRRIIGWDPDRWGILRLAEVVKDFQAWLERLQGGPAQQAEAPAFIDAMLTSLPPIDRLLGPAPWFSALVNTLRQIREGAPIADFRPVVQAWYPWLLPYENINAISPEVKKPDAQEIQSTLHQFVQHLKSWSDVDAGLILVRTGAPAHYPACNQLLDGFQSVIALNANLDRVESDCAEPAHPELRQTCEVLKTLASWRRALTDEGLTAALEVLSQPSNEDWRLLAHAKEETALWENDFGPHLEALNGFEDPPEGASPSKLSTATQTAYELRLTWASIYDSGLHQRFLETLEEIIETARADFFEWRRSLEHHPDRVKFLLYHSQLKRIREISDTLLRLSQHSRQARLSFAELGKTQEVSLSSQLDTAENLLDHLSGLESLLIAEETERRFPAWHTAFQAVRTAKTQAARREATLALPSEHPLYAWLVQSVLAR